MGTPTRRPVELALRKLEDIAVAKARSIRPKPFDEADWPDRFAREGKAGRFTHEPDFPTAPGDPSGRVDEGEGLHRPAVRATRGVRAGPPVAAHPA